MIALAECGDIPAIIAIACQFNDELAFVRRNSLERGIENGELYIAKVNDQIVGFCNWHARRDGWNTIYDLAIDKAYQGRGIGRNLLYAVPCPMRLKVTIDNLTANKFYLSAGMRLASTEKGLKRALNIYEMRILSIIVRGANRGVPDVCRLSGSAYGAMEKNQPYAWPFMADVDFDKPKWDRYLEFIREWLPTQALVIDYADPALKDDMLSQVQALRDAGVLRIVVCVKFHGATTDIPRDCIIGVSLRTNGKLAKGRNKFAGFMPHFEELTGRKCHLLGGSPILQKDTIAKLQGVGATVISVDGNAQFGAATKSSVYGGGKWNRRERTKVGYHEAVLASSRAIQRELNSIGEIAQLPLWSNS